MIGQPEADARTLALNFTDNREYPFSLVFSVIVGMLVLRLTATLLFNENIGPLIKILGKMTNAFCQFFALYSLFAGLFSIIFFTAFNNASSAYSSIYKSFILIFDLSIGNFDLMTFNNIEDLQMRYMA